MGRAFLELVTAPTSSPLELARVKARLRGFEAADATEDQALQSIIDACVDLLDGPHGILGRCLAPQTWDERFASWPCGAAALELSLAPVSTVVSVNYFDADGVEQEFDASNYELVKKTDEPMIRAFDRNWPVTDTRRMYPIRVRYTAGFETIPPKLVEAMTMIVGQLYEHRDAMGVGAIADALQRDPMIAQFARPHL